MECDNCKGKGLVGNGETPWMMQGAIETCKACTGTGLVPEPVNIISTLEPQIEEKKRLESTSE